MDISTLLNGLQSGLSAVGFIALSILLMNWVKGLNERNKELSEVDKEIRTVLRDSFIAQKDLHDIEKKRLAMELDDLSKELKHKSINLNENTELLKTVVLALEVGNTMIKNATGEVVGRIKSESILAYQDAISLMVKEGVVTTEQCSEILKMKPSEIAVKESSSFGVKIATMLTILFANQALTAGATDEGALKMQRILNYILDNPDAARADVQGAVKAALRNRS